MVSVRIQDVTSLPTVTVRIIYRTWKSYVVSQVKGPLLPQRESDNNEHSLSLSVMTSWLGIESSQPWSRIYCESSIKLSQSLSVTDWRSGNECPDSLWASASKIESMSGIDLQSLSVADCKSDIKLSQSSSVSDWKSGAMWPDWPSLCQSSNHSGSRISSSPESSMLYVHWLGLRECFGQCWKESHGVDVGLEAACSTG